MGSQLLLLRGDTRLFMVSNSLVAQDYDAVWTGDTAKSCHWLSMHPSKVCRRFWASCVYAGDVMLETKRWNRGLLTFCRTTVLDIFALASEPFLWHDSVQVEIFCVQWSACDRAAWYVLLGNFNVWLAGLWYACEKKTKEVYGFIYSLGSGLLIKLSALWPVIWRGVSSTRCIVVYARTLWQRVSRANCDYENVCSINYQDSGRSFFLSEQWVLCTRFFHFCLSRFCYALISARSHPWVSVANARSQLFHFHNPTSW
jgi:hypothetical protein